MHRGLGLNVTEFVHPVMRQLQMPQVPVGISLVDPFDPAFEKVRALGRDDRRRGARLRRPEVAGIPDQREPLIARQFVHPAERQLGVFVQFAGRRVAIRVDPSIGHDLLCRSVGHHREADRRHAAPAHRFRHRTERATFAHPPRTGDPAGMGVDIDRRRGLERAPGVGLTLRRRLRRIGGGAGRHAQQRAGCQHAAPRHRGPTRRLQQPRTVQLITPTRDRVPPHPPNAGQPKRPATQRYGRGGEHLDRRRAIARETAWATTRLSDQDEMRRAHHWQGGGGEAGDLDCRLIGEVRPRRAEVPPVQSHGIGSPVRSAPAFIVIGPPPRHGRRKPARTPTPHQTWLP